MDFRRAVENYWSLHVYSVAARGPEIKDECMLVLAVITIIPQLLLSQLGICDSTPVCTLS